MKSFGLIFNFCDYVSSQCSCSRCAYSTLRKWIGLTILIKFKDHYPTLIWYLSEGHFTSILKLCQHVFILSVVYKWRYTPSNTQSGVAHCRIYFLNTLCTTSCEAECTMHTLPCPLKLCRILYTLLELYSTYHDMKIPVCMSNLCWPQRPNIHVNLNDCQTQLSWFNWPTCTGFQGTQIDEVLRSSSVSTESLRRQGSGSNVDPSTSHEALWINYV